MKRKLTPEQLHGKFSMQGSASNTDQIPSKLQSITTDPLSPNHSIRRKAILESVGNLRVVKENQERRAISDEACKSHLEIILQTMTLNGACIQECQVCPEFAHLTF